MQEAIAKGAVWASQKIMEQSKRWQEEIKPAQPVQISPELKVLPLQHSSLFPFMCMPTQGTVPAYAWCLRKRMQLQFLNVWHWSQVLSLLLLLRAGTHTQRAGPGKEGCLSGGAGESNGG